MTLQQQTHKTLQEVGIPITTFCKRMQISTAAYYRWLHNDLRLSAEKEKSIRNYIINSLKLFLIRRTSKLIYIIFY